MSDGTINNHDGFNLIFSDIVSDKYYLVIRHRNHLSIMSSQKLQVNNNETKMYDFTDFQFKAFGMDAMSKLGDAVYGLYAGDSDANGKINSLDFSVVSNKLPSIGYDISDLDMNGATNVLDYKLINKNMCKSTKVAN